jgi:hypothetical protein
MPSNIRKTRTKESDAKIKIDLLPEIAYAKIFPPIGVARVGDSNSENGWFVGPEWPKQQLSSNPQHRYKDQDGRVKRQAARFRIYGFDKNHNVVAELTAEHYDITWDVALSNKKSASFRFNGAFSALSHFLDPKHKPSPPDSPKRDTWKLRNVDIGYDEEKQIWDFELRQRLLEINGGKQSITGPAMGHSADGARTFNGYFLERHQVYVGEIRTDDQGRLLVLGGRGKSGGYSVDFERLDPNNWITNYANNDRWHDDVSDGPVTATVLRKEGENHTSVPVKGGAWVVVTPPDFAPDTYGVVTLYDVLVQTAHDHRLRSDELEGFLPDGTTEFWRDVYPVLERLGEYSWTNSIALRGHGSAKAGFFDRATILELADPSNSRQEIIALRKHILSRIRQPWPYRLANKEGLWDPKDESHPDYPKAKAEANGKFMPPLSGDEADRTEGKPATWLSLTPIQYHHFERWAAGHFEQGAQTVTENSQLVPPLHDQPLALTRSAMERCSGGAFYPGIEMTSIVRQKKLFSEAFRIDSRLNQPGDLSKHMACPWQSDFYACNTWWWPAQRPDEAVHESELAELANQFPTERSGGNLASLLFKRRPWARGVNTLRPALDYLRGSWIPSPKAQEKKDAYFERAIEALVGAQWGGAFDDTEEELTPWRLHYRRQQALDRCSGRYFQAVFPSPEEFVYAKVGTANRKLALALRQLREQWPAIPALMAKSVGATSGEFLGNYIDYAKDVFLVMLTTVLKPLSAYAKTAADLAATLREKAPSGAVSVSARTTVEVKALGIDHSELAYAEICESIGDMSYLSSLGGDLGGYNGMVGRWGTLGFVVKRDVPADKESNVAFVETETNRYDGLGYRDYFHMLMNIEKYPDFFDYSIKIVERVLEETNKLIASQEAEVESIANIVETPFIYSPTTFNAKLEEIYEYFRAEGEKMRPWFMDRTREEGIQRFLRFAVFNQCDGSWLRFIADAGPTDEIHSIVFDIWSDESGNGDPSLHHGNLYTSLLRSHGIFLPDLESREYADSSLLREEDFVSPVFQLAISQHAKRYFAELLGMTLYLEWEVLDLVKGVKLNDYLGIDTQFLRMHVGIDNAADGHGAKAKRAVELHLANVLNEGGESAMQAEWRRIWCGFIAFASVGYDYLTDDAAVQARRPSGPEERVIQLMQLKAEHGRVNHGNKQLGGDRINDLFDDPQQMIAMLKTSQWIEPGEPRNSRFLGHLTTFNGPMYKVFDKTQIELWTQWIEWLGAEGDTDTAKRYLGKEDSMVALLKIMANAAVASTGHPRFSLTAPDGTAMPVSEWFRSIAESDGSAAITEAAYAIMAAFVSSAWAKPYDADNSPLVVDMLRVDRPMGRALDRRFPELNKQIGRRVIVDWIGCGCPIDGKVQGVRPPEARVLQRLEQRAMVQAYGMGSIH